MKLKIEILGVDKDMVYGNCFGPCGHDSWSHSTTEEFENMLTELKVSGNIVSVWWDGRFFSHEDAVLEVDGYRLPCFLHEKEYCEECRKERS